MDKEKQIITICSKCAAHLSDVFYLKKLSVGESHMVDCQVCRRHYFGGTYEMIRFGRRNHGKNNGSASA